MTDTVFASLRSLGSLWQKRNWKKHQCPVSTCSVIKLEHGLLVNFGSYRLKFGSLPAADLNRLRKAQMRRLRNEADYGQAACR